MVLDETVLEDLRALETSGTPGLFSKVVEVYLSSSTESLRSVEDVNKNVDYPEIGRMAHSLKSSSANVGAVQVAQLCERLEMAVRQERHADADTVLNELLVAHPQACEALRAALD